jgi:transposase
VRTEQVPWARPGARHTRDFQDVVAWLAQRTDKPTITKLLRVSWEAVAAIVATVVADQLDDARLDDLYRIGVDEVSYRKGHRYLTVVADHDRDGAVVWAGEGKDHTVLERFYDEVGQERLARLEAVSLDMGGAYKLATDTKAGHVRQCVDPFHVVKLANDAVDKTRRADWNAVREQVQAEPRRGRGRTTQGRPDLPAPQGPLGQAHPLGTAEGPREPEALAAGGAEQLRRDRSVLYRCWQLKEGLRDVYRLADPDTAPAHLDWWLAWACRCRIPAFVSLSRTVRANRERTTVARQTALCSTQGRHGRRGTAPHGKEHRFESVLLARLVTVLDIGGRRRTVVDDGRSLIGVELRQQLRPQTTRPAP